jgi:hypothetical protein
MEREMKQQQQHKSKFWIIIAIIIVIAILFDLVLYQSVIDSIAQSTNSVLLTLLTLAVSENKLLQKFIVLNDEKYQSNIIKLIKQFTVISITSLVTLGSLSGLLDKLISNWYQGTDALIIMIVATVIQLLILIFINTQVKKRVHHL